MNDLRLLLFVRPPRIGEVKTRLAAVVGDSIALAVYRRLLRQSMQAAGRMPGAVVELWSATEDHEGLLAALADEAGLQSDGIFVQTGGGLGDRMAGALHDAANRCAEDQTAIVLVGSDIPAIDEAVLSQAARRLDAVDVVLGPAADGGYYLAAMKAALARDAEGLAQMFQGIPWSTAETLQRQERRLSELGYRSARADVLADLDTARDLAHAARSQAANFGEFLPDIRAVLPVWNEAQNLPYVLPPLFESGLFQEIIVADNGSDDGSERVAADLGARVTRCVERGYGAACLTALADIRARGGCDIVLFCDGDGADDPAQLELLLGPLWRGDADFSLIARDPRLSEPGALLPHAQFGNALAGFLMRAVFGHRFADLGPFRALRWSALESLQMDDRNYGWTIQMQIRAVLAGLRIVEIPARYRRRHSGKSKVSASLSGSLRAGWVILRSIYSEWIGRRRFFSFPTEPSGGHTDR